MLLTAQCSPCSPAAPYLHSLYCSPACYKNPTHHRYTPKLPNRPNIYGSHQSLTAWTALFMNTETFLRLWAKVRPFHLPKNIPKSAHIQYPMKINFGHSEWPLPQNADITASEITKKKKKKRIGRNPFIIICLFSNNTCEVLRWLWDAHTTCGLAAILCQSLRFGDFCTVTQYWKKTFLFQRCSQNFTHLLPA